MPSVHGSAALASRREDRDGGGLGGGALHEVVVSSPSSLLSWSTIAVRLAASLVQLDVRLLGRDGSDLVDQIQQCPVVGVVRRSCRVVRLVRRCRASSLDRGLVVGEFSCQLLATRQPGAVVVMRAAMRPAPAPRNGATRPSSSARAMCVSRDVCTVITLPPAPHAACTPASPCPNPTCQSTRVFRPIIGVAAAVSTPTANKPHLAECYEQVTAAEDHVAPSQDEIPAQIDQEAAESAIV